MIEKRTIPITAIHVESNAHCTRIKVKIEVDGKWVEIGEWSVYGGLIAYTVEASGIEEVIKTGRVIQG